MPDSTRKTRTAPLAARWGRLPRESQDVLAAAIVHEGVLRNAWLAQLAATPSAVDPLVAQKWIVEQTDGSWSVNSILDRAALRALVPWSQRRAAHVALARLLERDPVRLGKAADHFAAAGMNEDAGRAWLSAARTHCRKHQPSAAAECFERAIRHLPPHLTEDELVGAVRDFGLCASMQRGNEPARELLREWRELPTLAKSFRFQAEAFRVIATLLSAAQRHVDAAEARRTAAKYFDRLNLAEEAAGELVAAATTLVYSLQLAAAEETAGLALERARAAGRADLETEAAIVHGLCLGMRGETDAGRRELEASLDVALAAGLTTQAADAYRVLGNVREYASCYQEVPDAFAHALSYCRRHGETDIADLCLGCLSYSLFRGGSWRKSAAVIEQVIESKRSPLASRCVAKGVLGLLQAYRGEFKPAARNLAWSIATSRQLGITSMELLCLDGEALVFEGAGNHEAAAASYRQLMNLWLTTEDRHDVVPGFTSAAVFFATRGDTASAAEFATALHRIAHANSNPEIAGAALLASAELKLLDGNAQEASTLFADAIRAYEKRNLVVELLRARLRHAPALAAAGESKQAIALLREVRARAARLGARPFASGASQMLEEISASHGTTRSAKSPTPARDTAWTFLSPRQRDVARHVAGGRTNKEIALALGLSVRTIDMHVAHVLARLDCRTRTEAAGKLGAIATH